jgi:hypothetical protein
LLVETVIYRAIMGDFAFTKEIWDRVDGNVRDTEPISSPVEQALDEIDREGAAESRDGDPAAMDWEPRVAC